MTKRIAFLATLLAMLVSLLPFGAAYAAPQDDGFEFTGLIETLPNTPGWLGDWTVGGTTVHVGPGTQINQEHGPIQVNACVKVKGQPQANGSVDATKIKTKDPSDCGSGGNGGTSIEFYGNIETLPTTPNWIGDWQISGRMVHVTSATQIDQEHGTVALGAYVKVKGYVQPDQSVEGREIEVKMGGGSGGNAYVQMLGTIESLPGTPGWIGDWMVNGRTVHVDASTRIDQEHGAVAVGASAEVKGWAQPDGSINATKVEIKSGSGGGGGNHMKFYGFVQQLPPSGLLGTWMVDTTLVQVDATTQIDQSHGQVVLNAYVEVEGWQQPDGSVMASKIEVKSGSNGGGTFSFYGVVESFPAGFVGAWQISGRTVNAGPATRINQEHGAVAVGVTVEVKGTLLPDGSVDATEIEVKAAAGGGNTGYVKFTGIVEDMPASGLIGDWMVSGRTVHVTSATQIEQEHGLAQIGARVEVKGIQLADGTVDATKVKVK